MRLVDTNLASGMWLQAVDAPPTLALYRDALEGQPLAIALHLVERRAARRGRSCTTLCWLRGPMTREDLRRLARSTG